MSDDNKQKYTLTEEDMITSPKLSHRLLIAMRPLSQSVQARPCATRWKRTDSGCATFPAIWTIPARKCLSDG